MKRALKRFSVSNGRPAENSIFPEYKNDPVGFARDVLGVRLWSDQKKILLSVRDNRSTVVNACHESGKSFNMAVCCIWWLSTRAPARVNSTAPTGRQIKEVLWKEIRRLVRRAKRRLPGRPLTLEWSIGDDRFAMGFSAKDPNSAQGLNSPNTLNLYDEASGVPDETKGAMDGAVAGGGSRQLAIGNPVSQSGWFRAASHEDAKRWNVITIDAMRTPNVRWQRWCRSVGRDSRGVLVDGEWSRPDGALIPGLVELGWVEEQIEKYGHDHPYVLSRVRGRWVSAAGDKVIPVLWVDAAKARWPETQDGESEVLAIDIARSGGDMNAITEKRGRRVYVHDLFAFPDKNPDGTPAPVTMMIADRVVEWYVKLRPKAIHIDATGLGVSVFDRLIQIKNTPGSLLADVKIVDVVLGRSFDKEKFPRLMDELQWNMRKAFNPETTDCVAIDPNAQYCRELSEQLSLRNWKLDGKTRFSAESKNQLRERGAKSPDVADSVMMLFYKPKVQKVTLFVA